jgi:AraC-like DNA-binding protein
MKIDFNPLVVFYLVSAVQGLTTAALLLASARTWPANRWLGLLLAGLSLQTVDSFLIAAGVYSQFNALYFSPIFFSWSYGPLLFFYVRTLATGNSALRKNERWHFAPVVVQFLFFALVSVQNLDFKTWFWFNVHKPYTRYLEYYGTIALVLGYGWRSFRLLPAAPSAPGWLRPFLLGLGIFYGLAMFYPLFSTLVLPPRAPKFYLTELVLPVFAYGMGLAGYLRQRGQLSPRPKARPDVEPEHLERLRRAMEQDRLYRNPTLTLPDLASHVGLTPNGVSACLNAGLGTSFNDFVNGHRLAEVKQRLLTNDVEKLTILGIAYEAGFNSKTTFNRVFKESTGLSPKSFRNASQPTQWDDPTAQRA